METTIQAPLSAEALVACQKGSVVSRVVLREQSGNVTLFAFAAGEGLREHSTPHEALVLTLSGEATWSVGDTTVSVAPGDMLPLPATVPHAVRADTDYKMMLVLLKASSG